MKDLRPGLLRRHSQLRRFLPPGYHGYPVAGGWIYLDLRESPMMLARVLRAYEPAKIDALRACLKPGGVFVDLGANKGDFSLLAARLVGPTGRVIAVEPEAANADWVERSVARNRYANVEVVRVAIAEKAGDATLYLGEKSGWHSLVTTDGVVSTGEVTVPTQTLDELLASRSIARVDVVKIDVEGAEELVFAGANATFSGDHPMTLLLDLHPGRGVDPVRVAGLLRGWGFAIVGPAEVGPTTKSLVATR